jgi:arylsulfatase A-like enzyme
VLIFADDLGYGDLGVYGHPTIRTPNLDRLAQEGTRFTQFYSAAAVCSPSRAALLTGRLPIRSGVNQVLMPWSKGGLPASELTMGTVLKQAGYATACVGKWHLGHLPEYLPGKRGFDSYFGIPYSNDMSAATASSAAAERWFKERNIPPTPLIRGASVIESEPDQTALTARYTAEAQAFVRDSVRARKPFFLYLAHTFPHVPLFASAKFKGKSARGLYGDVVEELDWSVGELRKTLLESGVDKDTLVVFTSDNGPWLIQKQGGGSAGLLREGKGSTWEGGVREPFLAAWPGRIPAGTISGAFATTMDLLPTFAGLAGATLPKDREYDGVDILPQLEAKAEGREALHYYYFGSDLRAVRKGPWKLHVATNDAAVGGPVVRHDRPLLYNLPEDPSEKYDVADANPGVVRDLVQLMDEHKRAVKPGPPQT